MVSKELTNWINNKLPGEGGWYKDGADEFHKAAGILLAKGLTVEEIKQLFTDLYSAVYNEFN